MIYKKINVEVNLDFRSIFVYRKVLILIANKFVSLEVLFQLSLCHGTITKIWSNLRLFLICSFKITWTCEHFLTATMVYNRRQFLLYLQSYVILIERFILKKRTRIRILVASSIFKLFSIVKWNENFYLWNCLQCLLICALLF